MLDFAPYPSAAAHKLLTDNRDYYIAQSSMTVDGRVPTMDEVREQFDSIFGIPGSVAMRGGEPTPGVAGASANSPLAIPRQQPAPAGFPEAGTHSTRRSDPAGDPFADVEPTPIPLYRDGAEYERDQYEDARS